MSLSTFPYRRFVGDLTNANARLGADVDRYSFIVVDLHHLLLAGLPAHPCENAPDWRTECVRSDTGEDLTDRRGEISRIEPCEL